MKNLLLFLIVVALLGASIYFLFLRDTEEQATEDISTETSTTTETTETEEMQKYIDISAADAYDLIQDNDDLVIIDVSPNYDKGHIPGAVNYYVGDGSLDDAIPTLDKEKSYLVYCHVESASISGAEKLVDAGFENVYRLEGNYQAWLDAGYEVEK